MSITLLLALMLHASHPAVDTTVRLARGSAIEISSYAGAISVRIGNDDNLTVRGAKVRGRSGTVHINGDDGPSNHSAPLDITLPSWARVDISSVNGDLTFTGTPARLHAETVNGQITVKGGSGILDLESVNGNVAVNGFRGEKLSVDATGGEITVTGATGSVSVESVNGAIHLRDMQATELSASSVNEVVEYSGTLDPRGSYNIESHNGGIILGFPADVSATMRISTFNGVFSSPDIPAVTNGSRSDNGNDKGSKGGKGNKRNLGSDSGDQEFTATLGKGEATVTLDSFNGNITVRRLRARQD
jgi:DUF4097 and DUF4098 domain-containing protein YvlB